SGGLNISAAEVERVILEHAGIEEAAVIAAPDDTFVETPMAIVYAGGRAVDIAALIDHCNANLSNFKVPRYVIVRDEPLPRLATGKIAKPELRRLYSHKDRLPQRVR